MKGAVHIRAYVDGEKVLPVLTTQKHGFVRLIKAQLHPLNSKTVLAYYGKPKA